MVCCMDLVLTMHAFPACVYVCVPLTDAEFTAEGVALMDPLDQCRECACVIYT